MTEQLFVGLFIGFVVGGSFGAFCMAVIFGGREVKRAVRSADTTVDHHPL